MSELHNSHDMLVTTWYNRGLCSHNTHQTVL